MARIPTPETRQRSERCDTLPEYRRYRDTGCEYHPACLTCPFQVCRFETQRGLPSLRREQDAVRAKELRTAGHTGEAIARVLGRSRREVWRLLAS